MPEERKLVTILFADVTGSTALGEALDPEDVRALMGSYYAHARRVVTNHGGTLEKFIGDAVMAIFGLSQAHGDDAQRALAAALALREAVASDEVLGPSFLLRIGVNTGEVVATSDSTSGDFLVTGDAVNVSARLQQNAQPGEIIASERTMHAAQHDFIFDAPRSIEVKGKRQPLQIYPLKEARQARQIERPPLVGRRQDLMQLSLLQARTLEEQRPQLVSIVAPAGSGKTRLLEEFLSRLDPADGFQVATARCLPYGQTLTYWPLRGLLIGLLGAEITKPLLIDAFSQGGYKTDDATRLSELVLATLGIESESATDRESTFMAWRLLIETFAQQSPRIIIFEDLHWASESLLDLVEYIIHLRTQASLLLIALSRPELLDRRPTWGGGRQNFTALALQPLTTAQTRDLVTRLLKDIPAATRDRIVERSGGNPFFALELIRGISERGISGDATTPDVLPDSVHAAVLARIDLLSRPERMALQVASVASRAFNTTMLTEVLSQFSFQEIEAALDGLQRRDLITTAERGNFAFRHILIRDVAYGTLARSERIRLHEKIASFLETAAGEHIDEYVELIAYHYREAVQLARQSAVRSALPGSTVQAIHFLERASILAGRAGALAEAQSYMQSAISIAPESQLADLYEKLGDNSGWTNIAVEAHLKALEYWHKSSEQIPIVGARLLRKLLIHYVRGGHYQLRGTKELPEWRAEAQKLAEQAGDEGELWHISVVDLFQSFSRADLSIEEKERLRQTGLEAAAYFERKGDWLSLSEALDGYGAFLRKIGAYQDALEAVQRRLTIPNLPAMEYGDVVHMVAYGYFLLNDFDNSLQTIEQALLKLRPGQPIIHLGTTISEACDLAVTCGRWSVADRLFSRLEEVWEQALGDQKAALFVLTGYLAVCQMAKAREDRALTDATSSVLSRLLATASEVGYIEDLIPFLNAALADDAQILASELQNIRDDFPFEQLSGLLTFCNMYDIPIWNEYFEKKTLDTSLPKFIQLYLGINQALVTENYDQLASIIDELQSLQRIVTAARMRIVLAKHTGDRSQLDRARVVLEALGDRKFLRRLAEVEEALYSSGNVDK